MGNPVFRFTLGFEPPIGDPIVHPISEPDGWLDIKLKLERHEDFHSLVEYFDGSFIFYGTNGVDDGGLPFILDIENTYGVDATITFLAEVSFDDGKTYEDIYDGQLDLEQIHHLFDDRAQIPVIRDDFWAKFIARKDTPVNMLSTKDLDDATISDDFSVRLHLPSQKIRYSGEYNWLYSFDYQFLAYNTEYGLQIDWEEAIKDDLKKFSLPRAIVDFDVFTPVGIFEAPFDGMYTFDVQLFTAIYDVGANLWDRNPISTTQFFLHTDSESAARGTNRFDANDETYGSDRITIHTFSQTRQLYKGQQVVVYGHTFGQTPPDPLIAITIFGNVRLSWKTAVSLASTSTLILSGEQTIDGVLTSGTRILVKNQGDQSQNGIYVTGAGAWTRAIDLDSTIEFENAAVYVLLGTDQATTAWRQQVTGVNVGAGPNSWALIQDSNERHRPYPGTIPVDNHFIITADTTFKNTDTHGFLLHDAASAIVNRYGLGQQNPFYSELLGSPYTNARVYDNIGCDWNHLIVQGLQMRGYSLAEKAYALSFENWWNGANPIFNLGLGYEYIPGGDPIGVTELDRVKDWFNATSGPFPATTWDYGTFDYPFVSINAAGGGEGFTCGNCLTTAGIDYTFRVMMQVDDTSTQVPLISFIWALLDAGFNPVDQLQFDYVGPGNFVEEFTLNGSSNGVYLGCRVVNNSATDTKNVFVVVAFVKPTTSFLPTPPAPFTSWGALATDPNSAWTYSLINNPFLTITSEVAGAITDGWQNSPSVIPIEPGRVYRYQVSFKMKCTAPTVTEDVWLQLCLYNAGDYRIVLSQQYTITQTETPTTTVFEFLAPDLSYLGPTTTIVIRLQYRSVVGGANTGSPNGALLTLLGSIVDLTASEDGGAVTTAEKRIRVEAKEYFYNRQASVLIDNVLDITREYDPECIFNKAQIGYAAWQSEDISGIDDPQTKHTYAMIFKKVGQGIELFSEFIAASLAIETTRRQGLDKSTDYKFDNNSFIIVVDEGNTSPDSFSPSFDEEFVEVTGLLNESTRYNKSLSVARNMIRWLNFFNGALQKYLTSVYRFTYGEGNYDMTSKMEVTGCRNDFGGNILGEKQDIQVTTNFLHLPLLYTINIDMSWETYKLIRENRRQAIGISQTEEDHILFFIKTLEYDINKSSVIIKAWPVEYLEIQQIDFAKMLEICVANTECGTAENERMTSEGIGRITADGECRIIV